MIRIAYVDDNISESDDVIALLKRYIDSRCEEKIIAEFFTDAMDFVSNYKFCYDLIFIDPQTNNGNGQRIIDELRKINPDVILVLVSKTDKFAIYGYTVSAADYLLKSSTQAVINGVIGKALTKAFLKNRRGGGVNLIRDGSVVRVPVSDIIYLEKFEHTLIYHTEHGNFKTKLSLKDVEKYFGAAGFIKCNRGMLVNSSYIISFNKHEVCLGDKIAPISRGQYKEFAAEYQKLFNIKLHL